MGTASHLGPWRLGTLKDTSGTTAGTVENMGYVVVAKTFKKDYTGTTTAGRTDTICALPAGAQIVSVHVDTLVAFTGSTAANMTLGDGTTAAKYWTSTNLTSAGRAALTNAVLSEWAGAASTAAPNGVGIGPTDQLLVATLTPTGATVTAGTVQYTVLYTVRETNGAQVAA